MLHFVHVFTPLTDRKADPYEQKPFFGPDEPTADQREAIPGSDAVPEARDETDSVQTSPRFVALLSPPFL